MNKIESRCGLLCSECSFRESYNCGGCVETNGHPFHGECPVAKCCQDKGFMHCGECPDIPAPCGETDCKKKDENGFTLCDTCDKTTCGKLHAYSYTDPDHGDNPPGARVEQCKKWAKENRKMNITMRRYKILSDFEQVYAFLTQTYDITTLNSMMLPQYFEYAHTHPAFNNKPSHRMMIWENSGNIVGFSGYEMDIGEAYLVCKEGFDFLLPEMLKSAEEELSAVEEDIKKLRVSVVTSQVSHIELLKKNGYVICETEPIRIYDYLNGFPNLTLPDGFDCRSLDESIDLYKLNRCIWKGFDHGSEVKYDIDAQLQMSSGPHYHLELGRIVIAPDGEYACFLGMWIDETNHYAYLEPLCTQPEYRKMGLARYALTDAMKQTASLGAKYCFGGVPEFYTAIGFETIAHREFWVKERKC